MALSTLYPSYFRNSYPTKKIQPLARPIFSITILYLSLYERAYIWSQFLSVCLIFLHCCVLFDTTTGRTARPGCSRAHEIRVLRLAFLRSIPCLAFRCAMRVMKGWERNRQELYVANRRLAGYVQRIAASLTLSLHISPYLVPGKLNSLSVSVSEVPYLGL